VIGSKLVYPLTAGANDMKSFYKVNYLSTWSIYVSHNFLTSFLLCQLGTPSPRASTWTDMRWTGTSSNLSNILQQTLKRANRVVQIKFEEHPPVGLNSTP
jgi:hypothetical protein